MNNWRGVIIYPSRRIDTATTERYSELLDSQRVTRIYLDELGDITQESLGVATVQLVIADEEEAISQARRLIERVKQEKLNEVKQRELLELIETILLYKLPQASRKEIEAMFGLRKAPKP